MPEVQSAPEIAAPEASLPAARSVIRVPVAQLKRGMHVAELDRPWIDTPFGSEGFRIESPEELTVLRRYCDCVFVDPSRSDPGLLARLEGLGGAGVDQDRRPVRIRADIHISRETRDRFKHLMRKLAEPRPLAPLRRAQQWLGRFMGRPVPEAPAAPATVTRTLSSSLAQAIGPDVSLHEWLDTVEFGDALAPARSAFSFACSALSAVRSDLRERHRTSLESVRKAAQGLVDAMIGNPDPMLWQCQLPMPGADEVRHAVRVAACMVTLGRQLGLPRDWLEDLAMAGLLADIGKIRLPQTLLRKPGMLTAGEYSIVKEHVRLGLEMLEPLGGLPPRVAQGIAEHHERLDGSGYPSGLQDQEISLTGKIAAIVDSYVALTEPRSYANPIAPQEALMSLMQWGERYFHAALVEQFLLAMGVHPVGGLIELDTGEIGIVQTHPRQHPLEPRIFVLTDAHALPLPVVRDVDLHYHASGPRLRGIRRGLPVGAFGLHLPQQRAAADAAAATPSSDAVGA